MGKANMADLLKSRMSAAKQASELAVSDEAYQTIFQTPPIATPTTIRDIPLNKLVPFRTADIGFKPYPASKLEALAAQLQEDGLLVRIIVRSIPSSDTYEILAGHNRAGAARLAGWETISAEVVECDDLRAITIATSTNLIQRQGLSVMERGKAYAALLSAKNRNGQHNASQTTFGENRQRSGDGTPGEIHQKYNARTLVAEFFGVTEYEIRKAVKLTHLIPELQEIIETAPRRLNLGCADLIADYDQETQKVFISICSIEGYTISKAAMNDVVSRCPPPSAEPSDILMAWREARGRLEKRMTDPPRNITFCRKKYAPYLEKAGSDAELEKLFLEFLRERFATQSNEDRQQSGK